MKNAQHKICVKGPGGQKSWKSTESEKALINLQTKDPWKSNRTPLSTVIPIIIGVALCMMGMYFLCRKSHTSKVEPDKLDKRSQLS